MAIGAALEKILSKTYERSASIALKFKGNDLAIIPNKEGEAMTLFIGKGKENGTITGERYSRRIVKDNEGRIIKSHWDNQGKTR